MFNHAKYNGYEIKKLLEVGNSKISRPINSVGDEGAASAKPQETAVSTTSYADQKLIEHCGAIYLFHGLSSKEVLRITKNVQFLRFSHEEAFFNQGDKGKEIFFILSGFADVIVSTEDGAQSGKVGRIDAMNILGEMAFIANKPRNATCIAAMPNTTAVSFEINEEAISENTALIFLRLYINISNGLVKKLETTNTALLAQQ